jgi:hypothetical protein
MGFQEYIALFLAVCVLHSIFQILLVLLHSNCVANFSFVKY